jgi:hypothetical protein
MSASDELIANTSETLGLIPAFPHISVRVGPRNLEPASALGLASFGVRFGLSANQVELLRDALFYLPLECKRSFSASAIPQYSLIRYDHSSRSSEPTYRLYRNGRLLFTCGDRRKFLERFSSTLTRYVAKASRKRTFIYGGVVGWGGRAIVIPGRSSMKTALVAEFVRAGATYYSSEFAVVDKRGLVYPYEGPLQTMGHEAHRQTQRLMEQSWGAAGCESLPVGLVIFTRYKPEAQWRPRQLSPGLGLSKILDSTVSSAGASAIALGSVKQAVMNAMLIRGVHSEVSQLVEWVSTHLDSPRAFSALEYVDL